MRTLVQLQLRQKFVIPSPRRRLVIVPSARWTAVTESAYAWEAEAIAFLRERLPDSDFYQGWSNFEFVAGDGSVNESTLWSLRRPSWSWSRSRASNSRETNSGAVEARACYRCCYPSSGSTVRIHESSFSLARKNARLHKVKAGALHHILY
jgi:hypothetical protein